MNRQLTMALEDTKGQRNNALRRAHKAEAALAELRASTAAIPKSAGPSGLSTPLTSRLAGFGLPTPDTVRPASTANAEHRELMSRFDALLNEHRGLKRKHSELQDKWEHFKANIVGQFSPHKSRPAFRRPASPDIPTGPPSPPRTASQHPFSSSPTLPSSPAPARETRQPTSPTKTVARANFTGPAPPTPKSHNSQEVIATSDTEEEDWDPSKQHALDDDDEPSAAAGPSRSPSLSPTPSTPRRSRTYAGTTSRRRAIEEVLVPDSSPERAALEPESQTQSETQPSVRAFSAPPESPTRSPVRPQSNSARRPMASSQMRVLKRKASQELSAFACVSRCWMITNLSQDDSPQRKEPRVMAPPLSTRLAGPRILDIQFTDRRKDKAGPSCVPSLPSMLYHPCSSFHHSYSTGKTLNSMFEINKEANHGLDYQFDEVVRVKDERKQLHGGDCECCRDYYTTVGPLPQRQQPPRWRSESQESQPAFAWSKNHVGGMTKAEAETAAAIAAHRNEISRHRHQWAPTSTPPDYWDIGFPDTQQVQNINEKAAIMHAQKMNHVVAEARCVTFVS